MKRYLAGSVTHLMLLLIITSSACSKKDSGFTTPPPVPNQGEPESAPVFVPQSPDVLAPYVGSWSNGTLTITMLPDGKASVSNAYDDKVPLEVGTYHVNPNNTIDYRWMFSGNEHENVRLQDGELFLSYYELKQQGDEANAQDLYNQQYRQLLNESDTFNNKVTVGAANVKASDPADPTPLSVFPDAIVYTGNGAHFVCSFEQTEWYELPDHTINGYDGYNRTDLWFLPDGRVCWEMWLWKGVDVHDYEHTEHHILWGKYTVTPSGNTLEGETIKITYDDGETVIYDVFGGRRYCQTNLIAYNNFQFR